MRFKVDKDFIEAWADVDDWIKVEDSKRIGKVAFRKGNVTIGVFMTKGTVVIQYKGRSRTLKNQHEYAIADLFHIHVHQVLKMIR